MSKRFIIYVVGVLLLFACLIVVSGRKTASGAPANMDWPMWRCDAAHSAVTTEDLAPELHLQWVREYPPLEPAWLNEPRMLFDAGYEPVVSDGTMLVASAHNDSLTALDAATGAEKWKFFADGPLRLAPAVWQGRAYVASDDGCLYCLNLDDGKLRWKFPGAPSNQKVLGNKRLISMWPARGGPVVTDGTVYFAAGIWPFMGVFIYALDANTGRPVWVNDSTGALYLTQPHSSPAFAGPAPQGHLVVIGDRLLVPSSRSVPACFDRRSGELLYFHLGANKSNGGTNVAAMPTHFLNAGYLFTLTDGIRLGEVEGASVLTDSMIYAAEDGALRAYDIQKLKMEEYEDSKGQKQKRMILPAVWSLRGPENVHLQAGPRLYASAGAKVMAIELPGPKQQPRVEWQAQVEGSVWNMLAADGRLFAVTREGRIYCFGPDKVEAKTYPLQVSPLPPADQGTQLADEVIRQTGVTQGYCLVWGAGTGRLAEELARQSEMHVIVVDPDPAKIAALREKLDRAGLYGHRIAAHVGQPTSFEFPPYMASLVVSEDLEAAGLASSAAFVNRLFYALRPYGGLACFLLPPEGQTTLRQLVNAAGLAGAQVRQAGQFSLLVRRGPLPGAGSWTHQYGDPANTGVSRDNLVRAPLGVLWFGGSSNAHILPRHGHGPPEQIIGGRLFIEGADSLTAMDVYTGRMLWQAKLPGLGDAYNNTSHQPGANAIGTNFVAAEDALYVAYGKTCLVLDPATGQKTREISLAGMTSGNEPPAWGYIAVWGDLLIAGASPVIFEGKDPPGRPENWDATSSKHLVVVDRQSGRVMWSREARYCFRHNAIAIGAGRLFCIDRLPDAVADKAARRGETPNARAELMAFDLRTGKLVWSTSQNVFGTWLGYSEEHDILLQAGRASRDMLPDEPDERMIAYRGKDGAVLWDKPHQYQGPCLLHGDTIIAQGNAFDLLTGAVKTRTNPLTGQPMPWRFTRNYGCNAAIASTHLITFRSAAAGYYDLATDGGTANLGGFRSGCTSNLIAADGVLNAPDYTRTCTCSYQLQTSLAFVHMSEAEIWTFNDFDLGSQPIRRMGINLGAPGDRMAPDGTLWLEYPIVGGPSPPIRVTVKPDKPKWFRHHSATMQGEGLNWVFASGAEGIAEVRTRLAERATQHRLYTVRLYFAEPDDAPLRRVFDVSLQGQVVLRGFDILREVGGPRRGVVKEFKGVQVKDELTIELVSAASQDNRSPLLCGLEIQAEGW